MTLLAGCVATANCRRSSAADRHLQVSANMESSSSGEVVDPVDAGADPPRRRPSVTTPSPTRGTDSNDVDELPPGTGNSLAPPNDLEAPTAVTRSEPSSSPSVVRDAAKAPVLSFSVAAIMAKSTSPPVLPRTHHLHAQVELNHNNNVHHRRRQDCAPAVSPVSPVPAVSPARRASAFTVDGILNGVGRTAVSVDDDDADDSSCSAADDSGSNRSSPGIARSYPPPTTTASAPVTARQNLPFLHPAAGPHAIDVACKWPPAGCPYPWQYVNPPSEFTD